MPKAAGRSFVPGDCIYVADVSSEGCIYTLQVGLVPDIYNADVPRAAGMS